MQIGIVGLPYAGKSTLFQAITRTLLDPAGLARTEAHVGVVKVPAHARRGGHRLHGDGVVAIVAALAVAPGSAASFAVTWGWSATFQALCAICFLWMGCEGLREWWMSRRRLALGLSDPVVSNRLLMWGVFGLSTTLLCGVLLAVQLSGQPTPTSALAQGAQALFGALSSAAVTLAFFPPRAYRVRLEASRRAAA